MVEAKDMKIEALHLKLQGLWVGAALGELYANGWFRKSIPLQEKALTAQAILPHTDRLRLLTTRWLKTAEDINTDLWQCQRSQDAILNAVPLFFLDSTLSDLPPVNAELETASSIIAVIKTLDWLQRGEPLEYLLSYLLQSPTLQDTPLAKNLGEMYEQLSDRQGLLPQPPTKDNVSSLKTTADGIAQVLYLLLSSPNDFRVTVQRSGFVLSHQPELQILLAALSGFHNGLIQLPLTWRFHLQTIQGSTAVPLENELQTLGNLCAAQWAGAYDPRVNPDWSKVTIAASGQLRPR